MMKRIITIILILTLSLPSFAITSGQPMIAQVKLAGQWTDVLLKKVQTFAENFGYGNYLDHKFDKELVVLDALSSSLVSEDVQKVFEQITNAVGLGLNQTRTKIILKGLHYSVSKPKVKLNSIDKTNEKTKFDLSMSLDQVAIDADQVVISLEIPTSRKESTIPLIQIVINKPMLKLAKNKYDFNTKISLVDQNDAFKMFHESTDLNEVAGLLESDSDLAIFNYQRPINIPQVKVKTKSGLTVREVNLDTSKVLKIVEANENAIKQLLVGQLVVLFKNGGLNSTLDLMNDYPIAKDYWIPTGDMATFLSLKSFNATNMEHVAEVMLEGDFCANQFLNLDAKEKCSTYNPVVTTKIPLETRREDIQTLMESEDADLVASIDEAYVNKMVRTTIEAGYWKDLLKGAGIKLGPKSAFVRFNSKGDTATFYMDIIYPLPWLKSKALGLKEVRFPLKMDVTMRFDKNQDNVTQLVLSMVSADFSDETLMNGVKTENLPSNIHEAIMFKKKIKALVEASVAPYVGKDMISLPYVEMNNVGLESVKLHSEGNGHMMLYLKLPEMQKF